MSSSNISTEKNRWYYIFLIISTVFFIFPRSDIGPLSYMPHAMLGIVFLFAVSKDAQLLRPVLPLFACAVYLSLVSIIIFFLRDQAEVSALETIQALMRLYFAVIALSLGLYLRRVIHPQDLMLVLASILLIQLLVSVLQYTNEDFRAAIIPLYRRTNVSKYIRWFDLGIGRVIGTIGNPNELALVMVVLATSLLLLLQGQASKALRLGMQAAVLFSALFTIFISGSRTGIAVFALLAVLYALRLFINRVKHKLFWGIGIVLAAVFAFVLLSSLTNRGLTLETFLGRVDIWQKQLELMPSLRESPLSHLFGLGFHTVRDMGNFDNQYLRYYVAGGMTALVLLAFAAFMLLRTVIKKPDDGNWKTIAFLMIILWLVGSFVSEFMETIKLVTLTFFIIGYALASYTTKLQESREEPSQGREVAG